MKTCKICGEEKPLDQFHKDRQKADGLNSYCKPCTIAKQLDYKMRPPRRKDPTGLKTCAHCKALKPVDDYYAAADRWDGRDNMCKTCRAAKHDTWRRKNLGKAAADQKAYRQANPKRYSDYNRKKNYGLEPGTYDAMLTKQGGRCAICKTDAPGGKGTFHVDHCHDDGHVRGLLCHRCNVGIGQLQHDEAVLLAAVDYLRTTKSPPAD